MPDVRKPFEVLRDEWVDCTKCELGVHRLKVGGAFVFGEGKTNAIMFIGESPGKTEETQGRPFVGYSGTFLRRVLQRLNIHEFYISNTVACRSCAPKTDGEGNPFLTKSYGGKPREIIYEDKAPKKIQMEACLPRLYEEIYIVDPIIIVGLGGKAVERLRGGSVSITRDRGQVEEIGVPGAAYRPVLTAKKKAWARKTKGQIVMPVEQNIVRYLMMPTLHPSFVARNIRDRREGNPFQRLSEDLSLAGIIYNKYMLEVHGMKMGEISTKIPYDVLDEMVEEEESWG